MSSEVIHGLLVTTAYGNTSAGVVVGGILLSGSFYMCPTVECILCSENVSTAHCMKQLVVK